MDGPRMSHRRARFEDHWRKIFNRNYRVKCERFEFVQLRGMCDGHVEFAPGITAVVGGNGVGKSTLALAVAQTLIGEGASHDGRDEQGRLDGSQRI
jgi:predicted ATPase